MDILNLPSEEVIRKRLADELESIGGNVKLTECRSFEWKYGGRTIDFFLSPKPFGNHTTIMDIGMGTLSYPRCPRGDAGKRFPRLAEEVDSLDRVVSKYHMLRLECHLDSYRPVTEKERNTRGWRGRISESYILEMRRVGGLVTDSLLKKYEIDFYTHITAFSKDDVIPAVYSQKEFIDSCNEK